MKFILALISPTDRHILRYQVFPVRGIQENITVYKWTTRGHIVRSANSVALFMTLYVCPVFRSNLVLLFFHSD